MGTSPIPTAAQRRVTTKVVEWYLRRFFATPDDPGMPQAFADPTRVGDFAVPLDDLRVGDERALFKLLVTTAMFQRRQDLQIMRILRGISSSDANELTTRAELESLVAQSPCGRPKTNATLLAECDLKKNDRGEGACDANPTVACHLKRHTVLLKRYGHFGKVPTSIALTVAEAGGGLGELRRRIFSDHSARRARAVELERALSRAWRVNQKIASMFLSAVSNPDCLPHAAWSEGIDWRYFVVIDSNVDLFLASIGYGGTGTYDARREFLIELARDIDLRELAPQQRIRSFNPRIVQQAMYVFMSSTNRRALGRDCSQDGPTTCRTCPRALASRCALRS